MVEIRELKNVEAFSIAEYEKLAAQLPLFVLRADVLLAYIRKRATFGTLYALVEDGLLRGMLGFYDNDNQSGNAYLSLLVVDSSLRGCGWGRRLVAVANDESRRNHMKTMSLNVVRSNEVAIEFYRRNGFVVLGKGVDENHITMGKGLGPNHESQLESEC